MGVVSQLSSIGDRALEKHFVDYVIKIVNTRTPRWIVKQYQEGKVELSNYDIRTLRGLSSEQLKGWFWYDASHNRMIRSFTGASTLLLLIITKMYLNEYDVEWADRVAYDSEIGRSFFYHLESRVFNSQTIREKKAKMLAKHSGGEAHQKKLKARIERLTKEISQRERQLAKAKKELSSIS